jgi:hypothetical protein
MSKVLRQERPGEEWFEFTLSRAEQELILREVRDPAHVLEWVRHPCATGGLYRLHVDQVTELFESIESFACMDEKSKETREALQALVAKLETMVEGYYQEKFADRIVRVEEPGQGRAAAGPNRPCPCGSGRKYKKCCGRFG